jgi:phosphoenolpyruvate carboxylase
LARRAAPQIETARPLTSPFAPYSPQAERELAILRVAADAHKRFGAAVCPSYVISMAGTVSDILEVALLVKEVRLLRPDLGRLDINIVPLFETIADLRNCGRLIDSVLAMPQYARLLDSCDRCQEDGDADERIIRGIHLTINGIAAGLRSSG